MADSYSKLCQQATALSLFWRKVCEDSFDQQDCKTYEQALHLMSNVKHLWVLACNSWLFQEYRIKVNLVFLNYYVERFSTIIGVVPWDPRRPGFPKFWKKMFQIVFRCP